MQKKSYLKESCDKVEKENCSSCINNGWWWSIKNGILKVMQELKGNELGKENNLWLGEKALEMIEQEDKVYRDGKWCAKSTTMQGGMKWSMNKQREC